MWSYVSVRAGLLAVSYIASQQTGKLTWPFTVCARKTFRTVTEKWTFSLVVKAGAIVLAFHFAAFNGVLAKWACVAYGTLTDKWTFSFVVKAGAIVLAFHFAAFNGVLAKWACVAYGTLTDKWTFPLLSKQVPLFLHFTSLHLTGTVTHVNIYIYIYINIYIYIYHHHHCAAIVSHGWAKASAASTSAYLALSSARWYPPSSRLVHFSNVSPVFL